MTPFTRLPGLAADSLDAVVAALASLSPLNRAGYRIAVTGLQRAMSSDARRVVAPAPPAMASAAADEAQERRDDPGPDEELHPFGQTTVARGRQPLRAASEELGELESRLELQGLVEERERGPTVTAGEGVKPGAIRATRRTHPAVAVLAVSETTVAGVPDPRPR